MTYRIEVAAPPPRTAAAAGAQRRSAALDWGKAMMRPRGLRELVLLMCGLNLTGFVFIEGGDIPATVAVPVYTFIMVISYVVLWYLWQGKNWARWLVLFTSLLTLINLLGFGSATALQQVVILVEAALGAYLLYWLNTTPVRGFFIRPTEPGAA